MNVCTPYPATQNPRYYNSHIFTHFPLKNKNNNKKNNFKTKNITYLWVDAFIYDFFLLVAVACLPACLPVILSPGCVQTFLFLYLIHEIHIKV